VGARRPVSRLIVRITYAVQVALIICRPGRTA
jgi:hypothetical protein